MPHIPRILLPSRKPTHVIGKKHRICESGCKCKCNTGIPLPSGSYQAAGVIVTPHRSIRLTPKE